MTINLRPLADRAVVEAIDKEETFAGGELLLPETAKEKPQQGKVIAIGAGRWDDEGQRIPMDIGVGDTVLFANFAGTEFKIDGRELLILMETIRRAQDGYGNRNVGYDVLTGQYVDMIDASIIDPVKVTRGALENAASIAAMILTTEALVADIPEKKKAPPPMPDYDY